MDKGSRVSDLKASNAVSWSVAFCDHFSWSHHSPLQAQPFSLLWARVRNAARIVSPQLERHLQSALWGGGWYIGWAVLWVAGGLGFHFGSKKKTEFVDKSSKTIDIFPEFFEPKWSLRRGGGPLLFAEWMIKDHNYIALSRGLHFGSENTGKYR